MKTVYVIFTRRAKNKRWWHWLTSKKLNHVLCAWEDTEGGVMVVDYLAAGPDVRLQSSTLEDFILAAGKEHKTTAILAVPVLRTCPVIGPINCVSLTKSLIGLPATWVLTPKQLYNRLRKEDSYVIKTPIEAR